MPHDDELNLDYDDYDPEAEWGELQKIVDEQDALDKEEEARRYNALDE